MESFIWYLEALRNEPIDRDKLLAQAKEIAAQPAIVKRTPGDQASALAQADIGKPGTARPGAGPTPSSKPTAPAAPPARSAAAPPRATPPARSVVALGPSKPAPGPSKPAASGPRPPPAKK